MKLLIIEVTEMLLMKLAFVIMVILACRYKADETLRDYVEKLSASLKPIFHETIRSYPLGKLHSTITKIKMGDLRRNPYLAGEIIYLFYFILK